MQSSTCSSAISESGLKPVTRRGLAGAGLIVLLAVPVLALIMLQRSAGRHVLGAGEPLPALGLRDMEGKEVLLSDLARQPAVIFFFSVDCPHCQRQMPIVVKASQTFGRYFRFLAISVSGQQKTYGLVKAGGTVPIVLVDEKEVAAKAFGVSELPVLFIVGGDQRIRRVLIGEYSRTVLENLLTKLQGERWYPPAHSHDQKSGEEGY